MQYEWQMADNAAAADDRDSGGGGDTRQRRMTEIVVVAETVAPFVDYLVAKGSEGV
jgi:hypothetical protein